MNLATPVKVLLPIHLACFGAIAEKQRDQGKIVSAHGVVPFSTMGCSNGAVME
jgi:hypothetical protein